jgi:hypothetical protein
MISKFQILHTCTVCGKREPWNENWQWYGSMRDEEDGKGIIETCSDACRGIIPDPAKALKLLQMEQW